MIEELAGRIIERFMEELEDPDAAIRIVWEEFDLVAEAPDKAQKRI